jgi:hypothetical protein
MPSQLKLGEISREFRARMRRLPRREVELSKRGMMADLLGPYAYVELLGQPWLSILQDAHVEHHHELDDFISRVINHGLAADCPLT